MYILKKLKFLERRDCYIISNISKAKKGSIHKHDYFIEAVETNSQQFDDMYELIQKVLELGKKLYNCNKSNLQKIKDSYNSETCSTNFLKERGAKAVSSSIEPYKYDYLLFRRDTNITEETANIIKEWCNKGLPISFISSTYKGEFTNKVDMHSLIDMSIFMYLLFTAICNENIKNVTDYAKRKKLKRTDNGIRYSDIVENYIDKEHFYARIISYIGFYENNLLDLSRPIYKEVTKLYYEEQKDNTGRIKGYKPKFKRCFENIYSFYLFTIKIAIYSAENGFQIVNMCPCGEIIKGKADFCKPCFKMHDTQRKQEC